MMLKKKYTGVAVPIITPLKEDLSLDVEGVQTLMNRMAEGNVQSFIMGTTGEAPSLPMSLRKEFIKVAADAKRVGHLYVGVSTFTLSETIELSRLAADHGADVVVATMPAFYAPTRKQIIDYYTQLADQSPLPLFLYNIPSTTHVVIPLDVVEELSYHKNIVGFKDSQQDDERLVQALNLWKDREDFSHYMGSAARSKMALELGSSGIVPSAGNVRPDWYARLFEKAIHGLDASEDQRITDELGQVYQKGKTLGESLWALKEMLNVHNVCSSYMMPPLSKGDEAQTKALRECYTEFQSLNYV